MDVVTSQVSGAVPTHQVKCWIPVCGSESPVHWTGTEELTSQQFGFSLRFFFKTCVLGVYLSNLNRLHLLLKRFRQSIHNYQKTDFKRRHSKC